jgi:uncharacterized repeat protein (TIGR01451 family)
MVASRSRIWANLALGAALLGASGWGYAQPMSEPPPRPLGLDAEGKKVIATTNAPTAPSPFSVQLTVPDDGLGAPIKPSHAVGYRGDAEPPLAPAPLPAQVSVEVAGPASIALGEPLRYELIVRNTGDAPACRVQVEAPLPSSARLLRADPPAELRAESLIWNLGTLEAGAERHLKVDLQHFGIAKMEAPRVAYTAAAGLHAQVIRAPFMVALFGPNSANRGQTVTFQIQLSNDGTAPIRHIVLRDQLPPGLIYLRGYVIEAEVGDLAPGQSRTVRLDATAAQVGRFVNEVLATADGGVRATSRCAVEVVAGPEEKPNDGSSFAAGRK